MASVAVSAPAHADYKGDYARGLEAYKAGRLAEARTLFMQAMIEHPEPAARVKLYGTRFEPYLPQHYLGMIAVAQGDCAGALAQWAVAGNPQVVAEVADAASEEKSAGARCASGTIAQKMTPPPTPPAAPKQTAPAPSPDVAQKFPPPPAPTALQKDAALEPSVAQKSAPGETKVLPQIAESRPERPAEKPAAPEKTTAPDQLVQAFENFLSGRLGEVARINPDGYADARLRFHAYLVRSGARFTLAQLGDASQLDVARADARAAHQLDPRAAPDAMVFSPHFRAFYAENR